MGLASQADVCFMPTSSDSPLIGQRLARNGRETDAKLDVAPGEAGLFDMRGGGNKLANGLTIGQGVNVQWKKCLNRIAYLAERQGGTELFQLMGKSPGGDKEMIQFYRSILASPDDPKKQALVVALFNESYKAE